MADGEKYEPTAGLEQRWQAIREAAGEISSEVRVSLVIGGVNITEIYKVRDTRESPTTLGGALDEIEALIADPRVSDVADATLRMQFAESMAKEVAVLTDRRQREYRAAVTALNQALFDDLNLEDDDRAQALVDLASDDERVDPILQIMAAMSRQPAADERPGRTLGGILRQKGGDDTPVDAETDS